MRHAGERSARIANIGPEPYGSLYQPIPAAPYRGKTLRFSAWLRTRDATGNVFGAGAGLTLLAKSGGYVLSDAQMKADAVSGTTGWARRAVELQVPADAERIEAGFTLFGPGTAWFDDAALELLAP